MVKTPRLNADQLMSDSIHQLVSLKNPSKDARGSCDFCKGMTYSQNFLQMSAKNGNLKRTSLSFPGTTKKKGECFAGYVDYQAARH